jgi:hypothetical protein
MTDLLVLQSENDKKALIFLYGSPISESARGLWYEQVLPVRTVSFVQEIRQESFSMFYQFFFSDGMSSLLTNFSTIDVSWFSHFACDYSSRYSLPRQSRIKFLLSYQFQSILSGTTKDGNFNGPFPFPSRR